MKIVWCLGVFGLMIGCAPMQSLEELEAEALQSGDWSRVEERERIISKRKAQRPRQCPAGLVSYCEREVGRLDCECVTRASLGGTFAVAR